MQRQPRGSQQKNGIRENAEPEQLKQLEQWSSESLTKLNLAKERVDTWEQELKLGWQEVRKRFQIFRQEKVNDAKPSIDYCKRDLDSAQARGRPDNGWFYRNLVNHHPRTFEDEIEFLQERLDNAYQKLKEVGNYKTYLEFKRYKEKCKSGVKDAQDLIYFTASWVSVIPDLVMIRYLNLLTHFRFSIRPLSCQAQAPRLLQSPS